MSKPNYVSLNVAGGMMDAYLSQPAGEGKFPAIILLQEAFGVNHHIRNMADRLAKEGYFVIAPELFHRTAPPGFETGYTDFSLVKGHFEALTTETFAEDLQATYSWLQQNEKINKNKIGSIGFCLGGRASLLANILLPVAASVSYYGGRSTVLVDRVKDMHAPHLFFWGGLDKNIPQEQVDTVINAVKAAGKEYINVVMSAADHGFNCDERASYNEQAAKDAWALTINFFAQRLKV